MAAPHWKTFSSTWRVTARVKRACHERGRRRQPAAHRGRGPASLVPDRQLLAAFRRPLLLAHRADDPLGIHPDLPDAPVEFFRAGWRRSVWLGVAWVSAVLWP